MKISPLGKIFAPEIFIGFWAVHNFMRGIFTHENLWARFSFSCMKFSFSCMEIIFMHGNFIFIYEIFR